MARDIIKDAQKEALIIKQNEIASLQDKLDRIESFIGLPFETTVEELKKGVQDIISSS